MGIKCNRSSRHQTKGKEDMNNKKNLKMKPVGSEYMEQYNALLRYVFQVTEQELSSIGWQEREIIRAKFPTMEKADVIGWFEMIPWFLRWQFIRCMYGSLGRLMRWAVLPV